MMLKIKNRENGFTLIELLLVILMISIISAIAVAKFQSAMISANEASAISAMRVISQAENSWNINSGGYATLGRLRREGFIDSRFGGLSGEATESEKVSGYKFNLIFIDASPPDGTSNYILTALPAYTNIITRSGSRRFGVDKSGTIYGDRNDLENSFADVSELYSVEPVGQ